MSAGEIEVIFDRRDDSYHPAGENLTGQVNYL